MFYFLVHHSRFAHLNNIDYKHVKLHTVNVHTMK